MESISSLLRLSQTWIGTFLFTVVKFWYLRHGGLAFMRKTSWMNPYWCRSVFHEINLICTAKNVLVIVVWISLEQVFAVHLSLHFALITVWLSHGQDVYEPFICSFIHLPKTLLSLSNDGSTTVYNRICKQKGNGKSFHPAKQNSIFNTFPNNAKSFLNIPFWKKNPTSNERSYVCL